MAESKDEVLAKAILGGVFGINVRTPYIIEKNVRKIAMNMFDEGDIREAKILLDMWNTRYKPKHRKNIKVRAIARAVRSARLNKWNTARDEAAEAILQNDYEEAQDIIEEYSEEVGPKYRKLFMDSVEHRAKQFRIQGKVQ